MYEINQQQLAEVARRAIKKHRVRAYESKRGDQLLSMLANYV